MRVDSTSRRPRAGLVTYPARKRGESPSLSAVRRSVAASLDIVRATSIPIAEVIKPFSEIARTFDTLMRQLRAQGDAVLLDVFEEGTVGLSPGIESGRLQVEIIDHRCSTAPHVHIGQQEEQHRTSTISFPSRLFALSLKGAGLSSVSSYEEGCRPVLDCYSRSFAERHQLHRPFFFSPRSGSEPTASYRWLERDARRVIGGANRFSASQDLLGALAMHSLMMTVDGGKSSSSHIPIRLDQVESVVVRQGQSAVKVGLGDYFTNPAYLCREEMLSLAQEAHAKAKRPEREVLARYIELLGRVCYLKQVLARKKLVRQVSGIMMKHIRLVVLTKHSRSALRVKHAWRGIFRERLRGKNGLISLPVTKGHIDKILAYVYHSYGEDLIVSTELKDDHQFIFRRKEHYKGYEHNQELHEQTGQVYSYLAAVARLNRAAARRIYRSFVQTLFREIGALHGAGGHFGGYREAMRFAVSEDQDYEAEYKALNEAAVGGQVVVSRDVSVRGELNDFDDGVFMPFLGIDRVQGKSNPLAKTKRQLTLHHTYLRVFQNSDLDAAAETALVMREILFGRHNRGAREACEDLRDDPNTSEIIVNGIIHDPTIRAIYRKYYYKAQAAFA